MLKIKFILFCALLSYPAFSQSNGTLKKLKGFDAYMAKALKDWNTPGVGVGIVKDGQLVFVKGYGYRDYGKKLPITENTLYQIASNTKLFTATAIGKLVEEGKLEWDKPIKNYVPSIEFFNDELNNTVTIRDMLSHRTGISRHDFIWYKSDLSRKQLFERLKYLEPSQPLRQGFIYNNLMYSASGEIIELLSHKKWEDYLQENIFNPLDMRSTVFSISDMKKQSDYFVPFNEKRDDTALYQIPFYEETGGMGPAGSIISNIHDMSHWLIALMNEGQYNGKQVIPESAVRETMEPAVVMKNTSLLKGYKERLNPVYGMGRGSTSYRGHLLVDHGGDLNGIHSQFSYMPQEGIGVIVFVIGDQGAPLYNIVSLNIYERLLNLDQTPWSERILKDINAGKKASLEGRQKAAVGQIIGTKPSHPLEDYTGIFENPAYGNFKITAKGDALQLEFHKTIMPLTHFHYDRFDSPNDEENGLFSLNYYTNPMGEIDRMMVSLDEGETEFLRVADPALSNPQLLATYTGKYKYAGSILEVVLKNENQLFVILPGQPSWELIPYKAKIFRTKEFADYTIEFITENGAVTAMIQKDPSGEYEIKKI